MKSRFFRIVIVLIAGGSPVLAGAADPIDNTQPVAVVESTASTLATRLEGRRDYYAENSAELYELIDELLLPGFDVQYAGKLVLGREHWTAATAAQRESFIDAFYGFLVRTYAKGVLGFEQQKLTVNPEPEFNKSRNKALVRTTLKLDGSEDVQVNYALRRAGSGWKIYDVRIDGVSYIQNYRSQFDAEISARGIEAVIARLRTESGAPPEALLDATAETDAT